MISTSRKLRYAGKTHFHQLRSTAYLCRLLPNYDSDFKKLTGMNLLFGNTHDLTKKRKEEKEKKRISTY
jgi:hypothetical protein